MAHTYRFFGSKQSQELWHLDDEEVTHALKVLRLNDGAVVEVMDGEGTVAQGILKVESKSKALVQASEEVFMPKDEFCRSILIGALKPGDVDDLVAPLIELGVDEIIVFRQEGNPHFRTGESANARWDRLMRSALKQCKRPWKVSISAVESLEEALACKTEHKIGLLLSPEAEHGMIEMVQSIQSKKGAVMLIGGEKGLSPKEETLAKSRGFQSVSLGKWILRARTAAPAAAVFLGLMPSKNSTLK